MEKRQPPFTNINSLFKNLSAQDLVDTHYTYYVICLLSSVTSALAPFSFQS